MSAPQTPQGGAPPRKVRNRRRTGPQPAPPLPSSGDPGNRDDGRVFGAVSAAAALVLATAAFSPIVGWLIALATAVGLATLIGVVDFISRWPRR